MVPEAVFVGSTAVDRGRPSVLHRTGSLAGVDSRLVALRACSVGSALCLEHLVVQ